MMRFLNRLVLGAVVFCLLPGTVPLRAAQTRAASPSSRAHFTPGYLGIYLRGASGQPAAGRNPNQSTGAEIVGAEIVGAEIMGVDRDAPAGKAGLKPHDVIVGVDGQAVKSAAQLRSILHGLAAGRRIHLKISRDGKRKDFAVTLASRAEVEAGAWPEGVIFTDGFPVSRANVLGSAISGSDVGLGVRLREFVMLAYDGLDVEPIGKQLAAFMGISQGIGLLVRKVAPHSVGAAAGLEAGDVITAANGMPSGSLRGWLMVISQNQGKSVKLKVIRHHKEKLIEYTPGGHRRQGRLELPEAFGAGGPGVVVGQSGIRMSWFWASPPAVQILVP